MYKKKSIFSLLTAIAIAGCAAIKPPISYEIPDNLPQAQREFRAAWVATVVNIDWPSQPGQTTEQQQQEIIAILDTAKNLNLNAIVFQARPQCDAFYQSHFEPWSYYLTGVQGQPPEPYYDPLEFWVEEAHNRGMELHVWFNPYRAHHPKGGEVSDASIVKTKPEIVKELKDGYYWLDPSKKATQDHSINVVMDVVNRYDIDGVHFDDYFYPYPSYNNNEDFPDEDSWQEYLNTGGELSRSDWRRDAVNKFIKRLYESIKLAKPHVKFGLSPFGIWRPHFPPSIRGLDQYEVLYADARLWLNRGWIDYFTPQLYWRIKQVPQSFPVLLGWWVNENKKGRNLWPGLYTSKFSSNEIVDENINQIMITRGFVPENPGNIHFSMKALLENRGGINDSLRNVVYKNQALVPPSPWLDNEAPEPPIIKTETGNGEMKISWSHKNATDIFRWVVYYKYGEFWQYKIFNRNDQNCTIPMRITRIEKKKKVEKEIELILSQIAVSAVDRVGNESEKVYNILSYL